MLDNKKVLTELNYINQHREYINDYFNSKLKIKHDELDELILNNENLNKNLNE